MYNVNPYAYVHPYYYQLLNQQMMKQAGVLSTLKGVGAKAWELGKGAWSYPGVRGTALVGGGALGGMLAYPYLFGGGGVAPEPASMSPWTTGLYGAGLGALGGIGYSALFGDSNTRKEILKNALLGSLIGGIGGAAVPYVLG